MGQRAIGAKLYLNIFMDGPGKNTAAILPQGVKGAITKKAVVITLRLIVTREKHTVLVAKKSMIMLHNNLHNMLNCEA